MEEWRVSVLVTFYNQEKFVDKALKSIIDQKTDFGVKILVGDDGSSDNTQGLVRKWIEKYPDRIEMFVMNRAPGEHIPSFRASRNRLNLLKHVDTEYFIYLDGDDYYDYDKKLQKQVDILDDPDNSDCVACGHNIDMLYSDGRKISLTSQDIKEGKYTPKEYWKDFYVSTDTVLVRSSVISTIPQELLENNFNDNAITFSFIQNGSIYYIPKSWVIYTQTGDGIWTSGRKTINHIRNMILYDLCNRINPEMKKETTFRFSNTWLVLFIIRKQLDPAELGQFAREAERKKLNNTYMWIHYQDLSLFQKQKICVKALFNGRSEIKKRVISKIKDRS